MTESAHDPLRLLTPAERLVHWWELLDVNLAERPNAVSRLLMIDRTIAEAKREIERLEESQEDSVPDDDAFGC